MTSSGGWIRTRLVVPILSDIDIERRAALAAGRPWRARWIVLHGCAGLIQALALHSLRVALRAAGPFATMFFFLTAALALPPLHGAGLGLVLYVIPQAVPLSLPLAMAFAIGWRYHGGRQFPSKLRLLVFGVVVSMLALATMQWLVPNANQAFRLAVFHRVAPGVTSDLPRGVNELSLVEMGRLLQQPSVPFDPALLKLALHTRIALGLSAGMFALLATALAKKPGEPFPARIFLELVLAYSLAFIWVSRSPVWSPLVVWLPDAALGAASVLLLVRRSAPLDRSV
jgi:hypothetical protein